MANPTLPILAGSAHHVIHGGTTPPTPADVGITSYTVGCVITDLKTSYPLTADSYLDRWNQPLTDILYNFGLEMAFNVETHLRGTGPSSGDMGIPTVKIGSLISSDLVSILGDFGEKMHGWFGGEWADGTQFIVGDGAGTFERQKLRKDALTLQFRRYFIP